MEALGVCRLGRFLPVYRFHILPCEVVYRCLIGFGSTMNQSIQKSILTLTIIPMNFIGPAESILLRPAITTPSILDISQNHNPL